METYVICWERISYPKGDDPDTSFSVLPLSFGSRMSAMEYLENEELPKEVEKLKQECMIESGVEESELNISGWVYLEDPFIQAVINVKIEEDLVESISYKVIKTELQMATLIN